MAVTISATYPVPATAGVCFRIRDHELKGLEGGERAETIRRMVIDHCKKDERFTGEILNITESKDKILQYDD